MNPTQKSFLTSIVALVLCLTMFLGTTFAWFTDIVVSGGNIIQSGKLDAEMYWSDEYLASTDSGWTQVKDNKPIFTYDNWEPGYTEVKYIKVANAGNLNFKWKLSIEAEGKVTDLSDVIDVYYINPVNGELTKQALAARTPDGKLTDVLANKTATEGDQLTPGGSVVLAIAFHMDELAGNEYQEKSLCDKGFSLKLLATQATGENDSFDDQYDKESEWPEIPSAGNNASADVPTDANGVVTTETTITGNGMSATVPAGTQLTQGTNKLTLSVNNVEDSKANVTLGDGEELRALDVHVSGVAEGNTTPIAVTLTEALPKGLNIGNYTLYHVEDGQTVSMTLPADGATPVHNNFTYDPVTGDVTLYMASFSEVSLIAEPAKWEGNRDYSWYTNAVAPVDGEAVTEYVIANADQLAAFSAIVGGMDGQTRDSFAGKTVKLVADINLGDAEDENNEKIIFYPIGYNSDDGKYEKTGVAINSSLKTFEGTFDGNGHTVSNFYHNTWEMKGDHNWYDATLQYYRDGMGLFGRVYKGTVKNLTVKNFSSDGEIATTGVIAAYADGATFENIAIFDCNPRVYNIGNGGIVGCVGWYAKEANLKTTFKNITVDNSNKISALWGSYDVACGGIVGQYYPTSGQTSAGRTPKNAVISFENCHISAQMDVYNDVCGNYQYYAYRYAGMLIGSIRENTTNEDGKTIPDMNGISAIGCTVNYGDWNDYYYCEFEKNGHPSYSGPDDYKFSRVDKSEIIFDENGNAIGCTHNHSDVEDNRAIFLPFYQLFTGYGWGVSSVGLKEYSGIVTDLGITEGDQQESVEKFEGKLNTLVDYTTYTLGDIFAYLDNCKVPVIHSALNVSITNIDENGNVRIVVDYDKENWENTIIKFVGAGKIKINIQDYYFCVPTTITVTIKEHDHKYDNACDATCKVCGGTRDVGDHVYDNGCDADCNECGEIRTVGDHVYDNACDATCNVCGVEREIKHTLSADATCTTAQTCTVCGVTLNAALGHDMVTDAGKAPTCTESGLTEGSHCTRCDYKVEQTVVEKLGHKPGAAATCTTAQTCTVCNIELVAATGHSYKSVVTAPTCTEAGYTTHTCACGDTYTDNETEALGHLTKKFTSDKFTYRIGNQNEVALSSLFDIAKHNVTIGYETVSGNATVTGDDTSIKFNGTGIVKVTLTSDCTCSDCVLELKLEVVDAVNATGATNATSNNVVLLNDAGFSSLEVSGGYTLYGNGFTLTCGSDSAALNTGYEFVALNNGTIDNVQIVCPNFDYAVLYSSNMTESGNRSETTDKTRYFNVKSAVEANGNSRILNSYISGGRAAVNVVGGNCLIENSCLNGGAVATLLVGTANSVILRDVTLVQKPTASTHDSSKTIMGFSVLFVCDSEGNATPLTIEGSFVQNAWVSESEKQYVPSAGQSIISTVLGKTEYLHDLDGDGKKESLNLGFAYMPESLTSKVNATTITDKRTNKNAIPYDYAEVSILNGKTYVYSYKNSNGTDDSFKTESEYVPNKYGDIITVTYNDTTNGLEIGKTFGTDGWVYELNVDLDKASGYKLDFSKLSMTVNGVPVTDYKVNGSAKPASPVAVTAGGVTYTLTATVNGKEYTATYKVTGTETSKESPSIVGTPSYGDGFGVANKYDNDWSAAAPVLEGITIKYWSVADSEYKEFKLSDITFAKTGKQNGTNSYWEYTHTDNDFTLKLTNTVAMHDKSQTFGIPVAGKDGKLYFTIAGTGGFVSNGTGSRSITIKYEFTDNNGGETLTFTHTWSIARVKDNQYNYNSFVNDGTLTKLESSSGGSTSCVTPDTLITLADGTQVRVDSLKGDELLLVWNMETGKLDYAPIMFVDSDPETEYEIIHLYFSDGTEVKVIYEHGFWDYDLNKYVYLDRNADKYIGHTFAKQNGDKLEKVTLTDVVIETELTTAWSPVTVGHLCYFVNGMLSMPGGVGGLFNIFEVDPETMTYDYEQLEKDIETYGLFTYEELNAICPLTEEMFNAAGGAYLKISIGKGNLTMEELIDMINRYSKFI